jgi:hypothetical protein
VPGRVDSYNRSTLFAPAYHHWAHEASSGWLHGGP